MLILNAEINKMGEALYMATTQEFKALVVQGTTIEEVQRELLISIRTKVAYDMKLSIENVDAREVTKEDISKCFTPINTDEKNNKYKLQFA
ncbi:MAG: hypothetical protein V4548_02080 [Bacteroidota bacterium]